VHLSITKCQELHLAAMSLGYYALCTLTRGQWGRKNMSSGERCWHHSKLNHSLDRSNYQILLWPFSADNLCAYYHPGYTIMQPPLFRGHPELTITNLSWTGRWNYLDLDKLKHRKLSLVCLGFTSMNVPPVVQLRGSRHPIYRTPV
jgi:hypothetical protein